MAVTVENLRYRYPDSKREALGGVSFSVKQGEFFALLGPNGGGKSTLFAILSSRLTADSGQVTVLGGAPAKARPRLGVVFQNPSLDNKLTVRENMELHAALYCVAPDLALLERFGVADLAGALAGSLSGGQKRRVELAKALQHKPDLLLLDEPSTGLDPAARKTLWELLLELDVTLLVTTHLMDEADRCDRLAILHEGRLVAEGAPDALKSEVGGDVITIDSPAPDRLLAALPGAQLVGGQVRLEKPQGHVLIPQLVEAHPGLITSVSLSKPTLEDVFIHHTGRRL